LDRHQIIDLLPDRKAETAAAWMEQRPTSELVSRDRGGDYAAAARKGAAQALQVADRFHLMQNLTKAVELIVLRCWTREQRNHPPTPQTQPTTAPETEPLAASDTWRSHCLPSERQDHQTRLAARVVEYEQMRLLRAQGMSLATIAAQVGKGTSTVWAWLERGSMPLGTHQRKRPSQLDAYVPYVLSRWQEGCHNGLQLWRELQERGYLGTARMLYAFLAPLRGPRGPTLVKI
jgi:transposase